MYWSSYTENGKFADRSSSADKPSDGLLEAVIERSEHRPGAQTKVPVVTEFRDRALESRFKSCLSRVPLDCHTEKNRGRNILALRPKNLVYFDKLIQNSGLGDCEEVLRAIRYLRDNPDEYLRFATH